MSTRIESRLIACSNKDVQDLVWNYTMELHANGMEIPETVNGNETGCTFCSCGGDLMRKLCGRFPDTLFEVDFDTMEPYREYWFNGNKSKAGGAYDAPDFESLGIQPDVDIDWSHADPFQAIQTTTGLLTVHMDVGENAPAGITLRCDGQALVRVASTEAAGKLTVCVPGAPSMRDQSRPSDNPDSLVLNPEQFRIMRGLFDLRATQIVRTGSKLQVQFGGVATGEELVFPASVFPFIRDGEAHQVSELFQRHYENRDTIFHVPDETPPVLRVVGSTAFAGPVTPAGTLSAHFRVGVDYPGISIHCDGTEVARVEFHNDQNELRTYVYKDDNPGTELEPTKQGYVPFHPETQM